MREKIKKDNKGITLIALVRFPFRNLTFFLFYSKIEKVDSCKAKE